MVGTFYWAQYSLKNKGGAYVTASHNPAEYNGFKLATGYSQAMVAEETQEVRTIALEENFHRPKNKGKNEKKDIKSAYFDDLIKRFKIKKGIRVVIDGSCATAGVIMSDLFRKFACEVVESNCKLDGNFPLGTPDPTEKLVIERLAEKVTAAKADIGFTYDADGDRIGIVDEKGGIIWNDILVSIFAIDVLENHPKSIIMYNTLCSKVVEETILKYGGQPFMWRTGHGFLKRKNEEVGAAFIGELSGHFFFSKDYYNHDDGAYSALRLLNYLSRTNQTLSQAIAALPKYISSPEIKVGCADDKKTDLMKKIGLVLRKDFPKAEVIDDERAGDGVRLDMPDSMFVIRYSQNGPYITIKFEAKTEEKYHELKNYINKLLHSYSEIDWGYGVNVESLE
jgi:phosphomannomutase/phosphoglucomutase